MRNLLHTSHEHLNTRWRSLQHQWNTTGEQWQDSVRQRFERHYWAEYANSVTPALGELARLAELVERARKEVP